MVEGKVPRSQINAYFCKSMSLSNLTYFNKLSVLRLAVDLIKADGRIDKDEVRILSNLQKRFDFSQEDLDRIHYITLQQASENLKNLDETTVSSLIDLLVNVMCVDNDIDYEENILLTSLKMSLSSKSRSWCDIVSAEGVMDETSGRQIMYLEDTPNELVHQIFDNKYDKLLITKAFNDLDLDFFYLPDVSGCVKDMSLLGEAMKFIVPIGATTTFKQSKHGAIAFDPDAFFYFILSRYNINVSSLKSTSFLLLKIRDSYVMDDDNNLKKVVDFMVIYLSDDVRGRIYSFVSKFDKKQGQIPYEGCYKILYDFLSAETKNVCQISFDENLDFRLKDEEFSKIDFESSPQAKTFYLLLLKSGAKGLSQDILDAAQDYVRKAGNEGISIDEMLGPKTEVEKVVYNTIVLYSAFSGKDIYGHKFLSHIEKMFRYRSSLKNYVNKGFSSLLRLADISRHFIVFDSESKTYKVVAEASSYKGLEDSPLWQKLL